MLLPFYSHFSIIFWPAQQDEAMAASSFDAVPPVGDSSFEVDFGPNSGDELEAQQHVKEEPPNFTVVRPTGRHVEPCADRDSLRPS